MTFENWVVSQFEIRILEQWEVSDRSAYSPDAPREMGDYLMRITSIVFIVALVTSQAYADAMIAGHGAQPCVFLNANIRSGEGWASNALNQGVMSWIQGFVSGANAVKSEAEKEYFDLDTITRDEQWAYVLDSCLRNPSQDVSHAVSDMMRRKLRIIPTTAATRP